MKLNNKQKPRLFIYILRTQFIALFLSLILGFFMVFNQVRDFIIKDSANENNDIILAINEYIHEKLGEPKNVLTTIDNLLLKENHDYLEINKALSDINNVYPYFEDIEVLDENCRVTYTVTIHQDEIGFDRCYEESIIQSKLTSNEFYWSGIMLSPYSNARTISLVKKRDKGYIIGYLNLGYIQDSTIDFISKFDKDFNLIITDKVGIYLVNENTNYVNERRVFQDVNLSTSIINGNKDYELVEGNNSRIISAIKMNDLEWIITVEESIQSATILMNSFLYYFMIFFVFFLVVFILSSYVGVKKIIESITNFSEKLINFSINRAPMDTITYFDEFNLLEDSFTKMANIIDEKDVKLKNLAFFDSLTSLYNRSYLVEKIIPYYDSKALNYTVIFIDLDNFSHINDTYGHQYGDTLLVDFSNILKQIFNENTLIRLGGDEFIILIDSIDKESIERKLIHLKQVLTKPIMSNGATMYITYSAGLSMFPNDGFNFYEVLKNSDSAMYEAKDNGRNGWTMFNPVIKLEVDRRSKIEQLLHNAITNKEFYLVFQPQRSTIDNHIRGFEALIRWENRILGNISPQEFIPIAEENRRIIEIGKWVLEESCRFIQNLNKSKSSEYVVCINCSPFELTNSSYAENLLYLIDKYKIKPDWIELEITENISINELSDILPQLYNLKTCGVSIAIDDFGTGYSSLSYLQNIPLDILKIDKIFIKNLTVNAKNYLMLQTMISLAKSLNLKLIAEGVETVDEYNLLKQLGCEFIQGYFICKPILEEKIYGFIENEI